MAAGALRRPTLFRGTAYLATAALVLAVCLPHVSTVDVNEDIVFDDVTSDTSNQLRPSWRRHSSSHHLSDNSKTKDNDIQDSSYFSPIRFFGKLEEGFKRVKRSFWSLNSWFNSGESSSSSTSLNSTSPSSSTTSSQNEADSHTETSPLGNTRTTVVRETRSTDPERSYDKFKESNDDEDFGESGSTGITDDPFPPDETGPVNPDHPYLFRITLTVKEPFENAYTDENSPQFLAFSHNLTQAIVDLYENFPGHRIARVINIQSTPDLFESIVMMDVEFVGYHNSHVIEQKLREHISTYSKLGNSAVSDKDLKIRNFGDFTQTQCAPGEISCETHQHGLTCLPSEARCNGIHECINSYDENNCPGHDDWNKTKETEENRPETTTGVTTTSSSTAKIHHDLHAIEHPSVSEHSTESGRGAKLCRADDQVTCADGSTLICDDQRCDGHPDCPHGDDEQNCPSTFVCAVGEFVCDLTRCIPHSSVCDDKRDCADNTDEQSCPPKACKHGEWQCNDGTCIPNYFKCNGARDCPKDNSDEELCPASHLRYCDSTQFRCWNGQCIRKELECNDHPDCTDGSDEKKCPCKETDFKCDNGVCIPQEQRCDQRYHCNDYSDERNCNETYVCSGSDFRCGDGRCIDARLRCNRNYDCHDGSDELNCPQECDPVRNFLCRDGHCIDRLKVCDDVQDCSDYSDEEDCGHDVDPGEETTFECMPGEFRCNDGQCINILYHCDQITDCPDKSDELNCSVTTSRPPVCSPSDFTCHNGQCIEVYKKCNGVPDCADQSDEQDCRCRHDQFRCGDGKCIPDYYVCDNRRDCLDNSDESNCTRGCRSDEFHCNSGECISRTKYCDSVPNCIDGSDEHNCPVQPVTCSWSQFSCYSGNQCVPKTVRCDNVNNCKDGSDEFNCANHPYEELKLKTSPSNQVIKESQEVVFLCRDEGPLRSPVRWSRGNGLPLPPGYSDIDGRLEIPNIQLQHEGTYVCDAINFPPSTPGAQVSVYLKVEQFQQPVTRPPQACGFNDATCSNGECISKKLVCNGVYDCIDGSDEMRCNIYGCEPNQFTCDNKKCVQKTWRCDSDDDCGDGSDERNCGTTAPGSRCRYDEYECKSRNQCIPKSFHCDMELDCQDGSDEIGCSAVHQEVPPPPMVILDVGATFSVSCRMAGVPTPEIVWRKNWGHIPAKCTTTSENGFGTIYCHDIQEVDQGAYSCEGLNSRGSFLATPDTILVVKVNTTTLCPPGQFNALASHPEECISCFCFGATTDCQSADFFIYQLPPPLDRYQLVDVLFSQDGSINLIRDQTSLIQSSVRNRGRTGFQVMSNPTESRQFDRSYPYFVMPENYHGNQLKSYGGYLKYNVIFNGHGQPLDHPDIIVKGNGFTLVHRGPTLFPGRENHKSVRFFRGEWYKKFDARPGGDISPGALETVATREDIMMTLANIENILIKVQYLSGPGMDTTISDIHMDSAAEPDSGQGQAAFVEKCRCPAGYTGLSCEECAQGFSRQLTGPWLGHCTKPPCPPGTYGDPSRNIQCERCPCPLTNPSNQFGRTCELDISVPGQVVCACPVGYEGYRCEKCAEGYSGNPLLQGDSCRKDECDPAGSISPSQDPATGQCKCKDNVFGRSCNMCKNNTFHLSTIHHKGCISCFCMGVTRQCTSLNWYRSQISSVFTRNTEDFKLAEVSDLTQPITQGLYVNHQSRELVFQNFTKPDVYYWVLPPRFLGDRISSYGGFLNYTLRYVPTPGGQSSRNNAPDVEIISDNNLRLKYFNNESPVEPNRPMRISVPMIEQKWQRDDGQTADREHFLMALADLSAILIKATYTTSTQEAALISVSLDKAEERNTNQIRTPEVEQCDCPVGYRGFSCEDCEAGYTRSDTGLYLRLCEPCKCNGHSNQCDPDSGRCYNCRDHTEGDNCEVCQPGYIGNPQAGEPCVHDGGEKPCMCDERGSLSNACRNDECVCKRNVEGSRCDSCRPGTFDLSSQHPEGCIECFCSSVTDSCQSSNMYITQIPMQIIDQSHGFTLTDNNRQEIIRDGFLLNIAENQIGYDFRNQHSPRLFWSLPSDFTGNKVTSYGGNLTFTQFYTKQPSAKPFGDIDVVIVGKGVSIYWSKGEELFPDRRSTETIALVPGKWRRLDPKTGQRTASRIDIMNTLSAVEAILIRATHSTPTLSTYLSDVSLDTAVSQRIGHQQATHIEICRCPEGYRGTSCELCSPGYYRENDYKCYKCPCNNNEESCSLTPDFRVICHCKPSFTGLYCDSLDTSTPQHSNTPDGELTTVSPPSISISIAEPTYQIALIGQTVRMKCYGRSLVRERVVRFQWSKEGGELPRDRSSDDREGLLILTDVRPSDSGVYICTASDGYSFVEEKATLNVEDQPTRGVPPTVNVVPRYLEVEVGEQVEFQCTAYGTPGPALQWTGGRTNELSSQSTFSNGIFYIPSARREDQGTYQCTATNTAGTDTKSVVLNVRDSWVGTPQPTGSLLTVEPREHVGPAGETVHLQCLSPSIDYVVHWSRANQPLPTSSTDNDGLLTIDNVSPADSGIYICTATSRSTGIKHESQSRVTIQSSHRTPPSARIEPANQTIEQGRSAELRCIAVGDPTPTIHWSKVQEDLPSNIQISGPVLHIHNARYLDRGIYVCVAESTSGRSQAAARVIVERREPPQIELYPREIHSVNKDDSLMILCRITAGIPTPTLHWTRANGQQISQQSEDLSHGVLRFNSVSLADQGQYICTASNQVGQTTAIATVNVQTLPVIQLIPPGPYYNVSPGQKVKLECRAKGHPTPSVSWTSPRHRYGLPGLSSFGYQHPGSRPGTLESAIFEISSVTLNDEGSYTCSAHNAAGPVEEQIQLVISNELVPGPTQDVGPYSYGNVPPSLSPSSGGIGLDESDFRVPAGGHAEIRCFTRATNGNIYLKWVKGNGSPLPSNFISNEGILYVKNVQHQDAGYYTCLGISPTSSILFTASASVQVIELPRITLEPVRQIVRPGDSAHITCSAHGDQPIDISWAKVGHSLPPSVTYDKGYLTFKGIAAGDAGHYICRARNPHGDAEAVAEVIVNPRLDNSRPVITAEDHNPVSEEGRSIILRCDSKDPYVKITWTRDQYPLPYSSRFIGNTLQLDDLRQEDSGRYICNAEAQSGAKSTDYINLTVNQKYCKSDEFRCQSGQCVPTTALCNDYPDCQDRSDERFCSFRHGRGANNVKLRIEPSKAVVKVGDNVELRCIALGLPQTQVYWTKLGDSESSNVQVLDDVIRITNVGLNNRGLYRCAGRSATDPIDEDYILNVQDYPANPAAVETKTASHGDTVIMDCNVKLPPPITFMWTKQGEELSSSASHNQGKLSIPSVTAADAGMYICTASSGDIRMDIPTILTVTGAVPFFSQAPISYIAVPTLRSAHLEFDIEISFKPEHPDGLILYNSYDSQDESGDFVSFGLKNGILEFRFDVGSGPAIIRAVHPIQLGQWHTVQLHRVRKEGKMYVDGEGPFSGFGGGTFQGLDLLQPLFLGGVPSFSNVNKLSGFSSGFVGCISRLVVGKEEVDLIKDALRREGVTNCETCAVNPCENNGVCQESPAKLGYKCICPRGFSGENCTHIGDPCHPGVCGNGKCINTERGMECMCPLNKSGKRCEKSISVYEPAFSGDAYLAYPTPKALHKLKMALKFNPAEVTDSVLLYCAQNDYGQGDFASISIKDRHIEFRFDTGSGPAILRSKQEIRPGQWVTVSAVRDHREGGHQVHSKLTVNGDTPVMESMPGKLHSSDLNLRTPLYVGGYDKYHVKLAPGVGVRDGFRGCISEVDVSGLDLDLLRSVVDSSNIEECSDLHGDLCSLHPCLNNAICRPTLHPPRYMCDCQPGFSGFNCENEDDMCKLLSNPCKNGAKCTGTSSSYKCDCPIGFSGSTCEDRVEFTTEVKFVGNGYIELDKELLPHVNPEEEELITLEFSTEQPNGILFWHGQDPATEGKDQDYLSLAVVGGYLEMSWELGNGPGVIKSNKRVDDGYRHTVVMKRTAREGSLKVDSDMHIYGEAQGLMTQLNTNGNIYLGGLPDIEKMTGRKYSDGLNGCIHFIQIQNSGVINLKERAISGLNTHTCSSEDYDDEYTNDIENTVYQQSRRGDVPN